MFKTISKITIIILSLCFLFLSGCAGETKYSVSGGPEASATVGSNGGMVIQKGNFLYYINGTSSTSADNTFGSPVKGSIVRMDITTKEKVIVVPKVVLSSYNKGGFYIFGSKIYYTSPSIEKDKNGNRLSSYLDYFSANLDGSGTKKILTLTSNSFAYKFFEKDNVVYLLYTDTNNSQVNLVNTQSGAKAILLEKYTNTPVFADDGYIYYTKAVYKDEEKQEETYTYNSLYRISYSGGTAEEIKYSDNTTTITQQKYGVTLSDVKLFGSDTVLYYTKKSATDIPEPILIPEGLYCYKLGDAADEMLLASSSNKYDLTNRVYITSKIFVGTYTPASSDQQQSEPATLYYADISAGAANAVFKPVMENPVKILTIENDYIYYIKTVESKNLLYKIFIGEDFAYNPQGEEVLKDVSFTTSGLEAEIINGIIYFVRPDGDYPNYLYSYAYTVEDAQPELISIIADADKQPEETAE